MRTPCAEKNPEIFVSTISSTSVIYRNYINDTCYQSVFLVKNMIDLLDMVSMFCYVNLTDSNFSFNENEKLLDGRNGLFSQFAIPKPGALALMLMPGIRGQLLKKGRGYLISRTGQDSYGILLCNPAVLKKEFCLNPSLECCERDAYTFFLPGNNIDMNITLDDVHRGTYRLITYHINREHGSLFDEWARNGFDIQPSPEGLNYLRHIIYPEQNYTKKESVDGQLNFHISIKPFEVILVEIHRIV